MPTEVKKEIELEIGHVLLIDIVGYSKLLINEQSEQMQKLREIVGAERISRRGQMNNFFGELKRERPGWQSHTTGPILSAIAD